MHRLFNIETIQTKRFPAANYSMIPVLRAMWSDYFDNLFKS